MDTEAFKIAIEQLDNGWVFENFGHQFLSARLSYEFIPVGGTGDKGLDGFEHIHSRSYSEREIFQMSTEKADPKSKIIQTIDKLIINGKVIQRLTYVTNRKVNNKDVIIDEILTEKEVNLRIWDSSWFEINVNHSEATKRVYETFLKTNYQEYSKPGKSYTVANLDEESRLYVFLRQQIEDNPNTKDLNDNLIDTLILFHLEPTDPEKDIVISEDSIVGYVKGFLKKDDVSVDEMVKKRLDVISKTRAKKIQYHSRLDGYCLPFSTRKEITERNLKDVNLESTFSEQTCEKLKTYLKDENIVVMNVANLVKETVKTIFYEQGLEFSNFMLNKVTNDTSIEKQLVLIVDKVVDESSIIVANRVKVKECLIYVIREIVYNGTIEQKRFLKSLSNTYMLMFLLQWDPKIAIYFQSLANKLTLFIGNSILIPAFSEMFLDPINRRHWNLLKGAQKAGVKLVVSDSILDELVSHFKILRNLYYENLKESEDFYLEDEYNLTAVQHIILRAYFYAKKRGKVSDFDKFLNHFIDPDLRTAKLDLIELLKELFGVEYLSEDNLDINIKESVYEKLVQELSIEKSSPKKAEVDAKLILSVYALREKNNETNDTSIFGYKTWWLSKDTSTFRIVKKFLDEEFHVSCYIRPDFLYNYIALAPKKEEIDEVYDELFPSLLGVNLSYHLPNDVADHVQKSINDHKDLPNYRKKSTLRKFTEQLKSDTTLRKKKNLDSFFEKEFAK